VKRSEVIVVLLGVILFVAGLFIEVSGERMRWQGEARLLLEPTSDDWYSRDPRLMERQPQAISNALIDPACIKALADVAEVKPSNFQLIGVDSIRGTRLVSVRFVGSDRDVGRVASNTFVVLERFCLPNKTEIRTENIDSTLSRRRPWWERKRHEWEYGRPF
jgi:hypothetical protein